MSSGSTATATTSSMPFPAERNAPLWIKAGSREYRHSGIALFLAGFASFSLIYCVQPLLPAFAQTFQLSPAASSLALSLTTGLLAISIVAAGAFSQAIGRKGLMSCSMLLAAVCNLLAALTPSWAGLLAARAIEGFVLGGVPAVAMAYLAEEIEPSHLGKTMGLYIAGTAFGAMMGRVGMGLLTEFTSWRMALGILGCMCLMATAGFQMLLPKSRNFTARSGFDPGFHMHAWAGHLRNRGLLKLYACGFILTSVFVSLFNYATFRLSAPPYLLGQTRISMIFLAFAFGIISSSVAGHLADRFGRRPLLQAGFLTMTLGIMLTLSASLLLIICGITLVTTGFFISHSVASSSIGRLAGNSKGHAASLYLLFYYMGSSIVGSVGGWFWQHGGWPGVVGLTVTLALVGLVLASRQSAANA